MLVWFCLFYYRQFFCVDLELNQYIWEAENSQRFSASASQSAGIKGVCYQMGFFVFERLLIIPTLN